MVKRFSWRDCWIQRNKIENADQRITEQTSFVLQLKIDSREYFSISFLTAHFLHIQSVRITDNVKNINDNAQ